MTICVVPVATAATITVGQNRQYADIQQAIDAANPGDTIQVYNDGFDYTVGELGLFVSKSVSIVGIGSGSGLPRISLYNGGVTVDADGVTLDGLVFSDYNYYTYAPSVTINANNVTVKNSSVEFSPVGISVSGRYNRIINCTFQYVWDTAVSIESAEDCIVDSIVIDPVEGSTAYGISIYASSGIDVLDSELYGDDNGGWDEVSGYGIMIMESGDVHVEGCGIKWFYNGIGISMSSGTSISNSDVWECFRDSTTVEDSPGTLITGCNFGPYSRYIISTTGDCTGSVFYQNWFYTSMGSGGVSSAGTGIMWNSTEPVSYTYQDNALTNYNGNFWDYYYGYDDNLDGVGDTSYSPYANVTDYYPLVEYSQQHTFMQFYAPSAVVYEGDAGIPIYVTLDGDVSYPPYAYVMVTQGCTATYDEDYNINSYGPYEIPIDFSEMGTTSAFFINTFADALPEGDEWINFTIVVVEGGDYLIVTQSEFNLTILDTSVYPSVSFETSETFASEGGPVVPVTVVRSGAGNGSIDVIFSLTGTATSGTDYTFEPSSLHFARGEYLKTINFTLLSDSVNENDETIIINLTATGADIGAPGSCQLTILDTTPDVTPTPTAQPTPTPSPSPTPSPTPVPPPPKPAIAFMSNESIGDEGAFAYIAIVRSENLSVPCDVTYHIAGGTATYGVDYTCTPAPGIIHFAADVNMAVIKVKIFEDMIADGPATANFSLTGDDNVTILSPSTYKLRINDTTSEPLIEFYQPGTVAEAGRNVTVVLQRVGPKNTTASVLLTAYGDGVIYGKGYNCSPSPGRIQFGPGESAKVITVSIAGDAAANGNASIRLWLADPVNAGLGNLSTFTLVIPGANSSIYDPLLVDTTVVMVQVPLAEIIPGTIFGFPGAVVALLTGLVMIGRVSRHRRNKK